MARSRKRGSNARAISDRSGFEFPLKEMVDDDGLLVHRSETDGQWSLKKHPLSNMGRYLKGKSGDPYPIPDASPDIDHSIAITHYASGRSGIIIDNLLPMTLSRGFMASGNSGIAITSAGDAVRSMTADGGSTTSVTSTGAVVATYLAAGGSTITSTGTGAANITKEATGGSTVTVTGTGNPDAPFLPTTLSGLALWMDAADTATITHVSNAVTQWDDKSGNARHFVQGTGADQPITNTATINSRNVIDFDGAGDNLARTNTDLSTALANDCTIFVVAKQDALGTAQTLFRKTGGEFNMQVNSANTQFLTSHTTGFVFSTLTITADTNPRIFGMFVNGTNVTSFRDGTLAATGTATATATGQCNIGSDQFAGLSWNGPIAEMVMYNRNLSTAEKNQVGNYLAGKWGTPWTNI